MKTGYQSPRLSRQEKSEGALGDHRRNMAMGPRKHQTTDNMLIKAVSDGDKKILIFRSRKLSDIVHTLQKLNARFDAFALIVLICKHLDNSSGTSPKKVDSRFDVMGTFTLSLRIIQADAMTPLAFNGVAYRQFIQPVHTARSCSST
jgi:hypothetical protein